MSPLTIKRDYRKLEGTNGNGTPTANVPCGKCIECLARRRNSWAFRLRKQMDVSDSAVFVTLTYEQEPTSFNGHGTLHRPDLTKFFKRLRIHDYNKNRKIKYYAIGEYGTKYLRPHYHIILFNCSQVYLSDIQNLEKTWSHGLCHIGPANPATIGYTVSYCMKGNWQPESDDDDREPEFAVMSKNLGLNYLSDAVYNYHIDNLIGHVTMENGTLLAMPRYYKDKIFTKDEKKEIHEFHQMVRDLPVQDWLNYDYNMERHRFLEKNRKHEKEQKLKRLKL